MTAEGAAPGQPSKRCKELENAVYDDWKRTAVDVAKKQAVAQFVDYDTFKDMVSVAHLRPVGVPSAAPGPCQLPCEVDRHGRVLAARDQSGAPCLSGLPTPGPPAVDGAAIRTAADFERAWRRLPDDAASRCDFLLALPADALAASFKADIKSTLLAEVLLALATGWQAVAVRSPAERNVPGRVLLVLRGLLSARRIKLGLALLPAQIKVAVATMRAELADSRQETMTDEERRTVLAAFASR